MSYGVGFDSNGSVYSIFYGSTTFKTGTTLSEMEDTDNISFFNSIDKNGDGAISKEELQQGTEVLNQAVEQYETSTAKTVCSNDETACTSTVYRENEETTCTSIELTSEDYYKYTYREAEISDIENELRKDWMKRKSTLITIRIQEAPDFRAQAEEQYYSEHPEEKQEDMTLRDEEIKQMLSEHTEYIFEKMTEYYKEHPSNMLGTITTAEQEQKASEAYREQLEVEYKAEHQDYNNYCSQKDLASQDYSNDKEEARQQAKDDSVNQITEGAKAIAEGIYNGVKNIVEGFFGLFGL